MVSNLLLVGYALAGTLIASVLACVPALHIYNVAGLLLPLLARLSGSFPPQAVSMLMLGMVVGYAVVNTVPSVFLGAPDESAVWVVLPGQRYLMQRRGVEAATLAGLGSLGGVWALVLLAPFATRVLAALRQVVQPHVHWLLGLVVAYILLSEWPKGSGRGRTAVARLWDGWKSLLAGLLAFALSGMLGLITAYRPLIPVTASWQGLTPAFVGLFAMPWVLQNLIARVRVPRQQLRAGLDVSPGLVLRAVGAGTIGGLLSAFLPAISSGIGGLIAGHATAQRDDRLFIVSQGTCKAVYYVGGLLFFFVPGVHLTRGGMAWMLSPFFRPYTAGEYWLAVGATALCGALAFVLLLQLSQGAASLTGRTDYRWVSLGTLVVLGVLVMWVGGWGGLLICAAGTGIGLIPVLYHSRRMNCMGVILVPILLDMSGLGPRVLTWLGLA